MSARPRSARMTLTAWDATRSFRDGQASGCRCDNGHRSYAVGAVDVVGLASDWTEGEIKMGFAPLVVEAARASSK